METSNLDGGIDRRVLSNIRFNARRLARSRAIPGMSVEDYEQDLVLDLLHRQQAFDPRLASFPTFADRIVGHRISTMTSPTLRLKAERKAMSIDAPVLDEDGNEQTLLDLLPDEALPTDDSAAIRIDVGRFVEGLPPPLLDCCEILLADSISEGARAAGIHRSTAYERAARLRECATAHGLAIYVTDSPDSFARSPVDDEDQPGLSSPVSDFDQQGVLTMGVGRKFPTAYLSLSEIDLCGWLGQASPGDVIEYHRGFLALDSLPHGGRLAESHRSELLRVGRRALWAAEHNLVHLVQRRNGLDDFSYLAVACPRPKTPPVSLAALGADCAAEAISADAGGR
jgi:hypothetical protein